MTTPARDALQRFFAPSPLLVGLLVLAWAAFGLFGREPWKPDEAHTVGLALSVVRHGDWLVPMLAGEPFMEKPPFFFALAAALGRVFGVALPFHEAARLATLLCLATTLAASAAAARRLYGAGTGRLAVLLLMGCLGLQVRAHQLITDMGQLAGLTIALWGLSYVWTAQTRADAYRGGWLAAAGGTIAFLCKGLLGPGVLALTALGLLAARPRRKDLALRALLLAAAVGLLLSVAWPLVLAWRDPVNFREWLIVNNLGRFLGTNHLGPTNEAWWFYFGLLPWFAFPLWLPLVLPKNEGQRKVSFSDAPPLIFMGVLLLVLTAAAQSRDLYLLPLLPAFAVWAAGVARRVHWPYVSRHVAVGLMGSLSTLLLLAWVALLMWPQQALAYLPETLRLAQMPSPSGLAIAMGLSTFVLWGGLIYFDRHHPNADHALKTTGMWAKGWVVVWALAGTLWLPYFDTLKGYRQTLGALLPWWPSDGACVQRWALGEPQRAMLDYYYGLHTVPAARDSHTCPYLLYQAPYGVYPLLDGWILQTRTSRPGRDSEWLLFYRAEN